MTEVESEWSDADRADSLALDLYLDGICACGHHVSLTKDKTVGFEPTTRTCGVCGSGDVYGRTLQADDDAYEKQLGENAPPTTPRPSDGRHSFVRMLTPAEKADRERRRAHGNSH